MGKKRRMIAKVKKFGRKFASHPSLKHLQPEEAPLTVPAAAPKKEDVVSKVEAKEDKAAVSTVEVKVNKKTLKKKTKTRKKTSFWSKKKTTSKQD